MCACRVKSVEPKNNIITWHYRCHECMAHFDMPVPRGPTEEKALRCPECDSPQIERVDLYSCAIAPPGG